MNITSLIPVDFIKKYTYLDDNVDDKTIKIAMLDAQEQMLEPVLGTVLYDKLISDVNNNTLAEPYITLLDDKVYPFLLQCIVYKVYLNLIYRLTNTAVVKDNNEISSSISLQELYVLKQERESGIKYHQEKLKLYLENNTATIPEYTQTDLTGVTPATVVMPINFYSDEEDELTIEYLRKLGFPTF